MGRVVRSYHRTGCPYVDMKVHTRVHCRDYNRALDRMLLRETQQGDVVFFASLKMPDKLVENGLPKRESEAERNRRTASMIRASEDLSALSRALARRGVNVVVEGPKPVFRSPTIRCSDWFNRRNPVCKFGFSVERAEMETYRGPIVRRLAAIARAQPNVLLWDPFPMLGPSQACHAFRHGKPLFMDADHVSAYANELLYPSFRRTMQTAFGGTVHPTPGRANRASSEATRTVLAHAASD